MLMLDGDGFNTWLEAVEIKQYIYFKHRPVR